MTHNNGDSLERRMVDAVVSGNTIGQENSLYWYSALSFYKNDSHPEYRVLKDRVARDAELIREAEYIKRMYEKLGVEF